MQHQYHRTRLNPRLACHLQASTPSLSSFTAATSGPPRLAPLQFPNVWLASTTEPSSPVTTAVARSEPTSEPGLLPSYAMFDEKPGMR